MDAVLRTELMISQPGVGRAGPVVREPDRRLADRASAPSLPAWRVALDVAAVAGFFLGLAALVVLMVLYERPWPCSG